MTSVSNERRRQLHRLVTPNDLQRPIVLIRTRASSGKVVSATQVCSKEIESLLDDGVRLFGVVFNIKCMLTLGVV